MSSDNTRESDLLYLIHAGIIEKSEIYEVAMRFQMLYFITHEVSLATFAKPALVLGNLQWCKEWMWSIGSGMDLQDLLIRTNIICEGKSMQIDLENWENVLYSNEENQHVPSMDSYEIEDQDFSISITPSDPGECPTFNSYNLNLSSSNSPNASYNFNLSFTDKMCTELYRRLIEETKSHIYTWQRDHIQERRRQSWRHKQNQEREDDWERHDKSYLAKVNEERADNWEAEHACLRASFLRRAALQKAPVLRVIDINATCAQREHVVLIDYWADDTVQQVGYTAISHTYGMPVYKVFDCPCASKCSAMISPRCSYNEQHQDDEHKKVVNDILSMCAHLRKKGVKYAWHDGVCIAQHNALEVDETIKHIGWIYANAKETVIFLHYVGSPMAPIRNSNDVNQLCCRWHTRVWTLQEAALSKCRRYCVRVGPLGDCQSLEEFEEKLALWYKDDSTVDIMEEEKFFEFVKEIQAVLKSLQVKLAEKVLAIPNDANDSVIVESNWVWSKVSKWHECTRGLLETLFLTCFEFPTMERALYLCCDRDSKHRGDKMNSILALAGVKDFVAPKDEKVDASTIDFFKKQGQLGLATALFSINEAIGMEDKEYMTAVFSISDRDSAIGMKDKDSMLDEKREHTWPPVLWSPLTVTGVERIEGVEEDLADKGIWFEVLKDDRMEWRGELRCVKVRFTLQEHTEICEGEELVLPNYYDILSGLDMDITRFHKYFKASILECITGEVNISALERCNSETPAAISCELQSGDSFQAHLVMARSIHEVCLIVQGSTLDAPVYKIGVFSPTRNFLETVLQVAPVIDKLIII